MNIGDLIEWDGKLWVVRKIDTSVATAFLESSTGETAVVGSAFKGAIAVGSPPMDWPAAQLVTKRLGRLVEVRSPSRTLAKLAEWLKVDEFQIGGALYLNPSLNLGYRDRLIAVYRLPDGRTQTFPIEIPRNFVAAKVKEERRAAASVPPPREQTLFEKLLEDDEDFS